MMKGSHYCTCSFYVCRLYCKCVRQPRGHGHSVNASLDAAYPGRGVTKKLTLMTVHSSYIRHQSGVSVILPEDGRLTPVTSQFLRQAFITVYERLHRYHIHRIDRHTGSFFIDYLLYSSISWTTELIVSMCGVAELNNRGTASILFPSQLQKPPVAISEGLTEIFTEGVHPGP